MSEKYKIGDSSVPHFITITVIDWVDLFIRPIYKDIIIDSLKYCRENKGLIIHAYCIMSSHIHLIVSSKKDELNAIIRDFKKFTSKELVKAIEEIAESRRECLPAGKAGLLNKFAYAAGRIKRGVKYKLWQDGFHPIELSSNEMIDQKLDFLPRRQAGIHNNPVNEGITWVPDGYKYSSASNYTGGESILDIEPV